MPLIYVTGAPGIGKSTLQKELIFRGYDARDLDDPYFGGPHDKVTGSVVSIPGAAERTKKWFDAHEWRVYPDAFRRLKRSVRGDLVLVLGVASNDEQILSFCDRVIYLKLDDQTLVERLKGRTGNDYGHNQFERDEILFRKMKMVARYDNPRVEHIDASGSVAEVAVRIVTILKQAIP